MNTQMTIPSNLRHCSTCGENVDLLIFSDQAVEERMKELADIMMPVIQDLNIPTWVLGNCNKPPFDPEVEDMVLKIWPNIEELTYMTPTYFCDMLDAMEDNHCL